MERMLWLATEMQDPEDSLPALLGTRPAPIPLTFSEATPAALDRYLPDIIFVDGRGKPDECAAVARKLRPDTGAGLIAVLYEQDLSSFEPRWFDDFVVEGCSRGELTARIRRLTSPAENQDSLIRRGEITIDRDRFEVRVRGEVIDLTFKEFELLAYLAERPGKVCSRSMLLSEVWGYDFFGGTRTVDVHVRRLRAKLGHEADAIETVRNVGYRFAG